MRYEGQDSQTYKNIFFSAPGGSLSDEVTCTEVCLFKAQEDMETMQAYAQVNSFNSLPSNRLEVKNDIFHRVQLKKYDVCFLLGLQQTHQTLQILGEGF